MPNYPIEVYRAMFPTVEFKQVGHVIRYKDNRSGDFTFHVEDGIESDGGHYPHIEEEIAAKFRALYNGKLIPDVKVKPVTFMAVLAKAERENELRSKIEALEEELEALEEEELENAPTLYSIELYNANGFTEKDYVYVTTSEEEAILWYEMRGQVRSTRTFGHGFVPQSWFTDGVEVQRGTISGRIRSYTAGSTYYSEALGAYAARLRA